MALAPATGIGPYDPKTYKLLSFHDQRKKFMSGEDTPRAYLERCLEVIDRCDDEVKAWEYRNTEPARAMADAATKRYADGTPPVAGRRHAHRHQGSDRNRRYADRI